MNKAGALPPTGKAAKGRSAITKQKALAVSDGDDPSLRGSKPRVLPLNDETIYLPFFGNGFYVSVPTYMCVIFYNAAALARHTRNRPQGTL